MRHIPQASRNNPQNFRRGILVPRPFTFARFLPWRCGCSPSRNRCTRAGPGMPDGVRTALAKVDLHTFVNRMTVRSVTMVEE
jgi:hypothetical protein